MKVVGSLDVKAAGASVAGASVAGASVAAGSSVVTGGWVAGAGAPQATNTMLATTSRLSKANNLRILLLLTKFERFDLRLTSVKTDRHDWGNHLLPENLL